MREQASNKMPDAGQWSLIGRLYMFAFLVCLCMTGTPVTRALCACHHRAFGKAPATQARLSESGMWLHASTLTSRRVCAWCGMVISGVSHVPRGESLSLTLSLSLSLSLSVQWCQSCPLQ